MKRARIHRFSDGGLKNVSASTPSDGQVLLYSSNQWQPGTVAVNHAYVQTDTISSPKIVGTGQNSLFYVDALFNNQFYASITPSSTNAKVKIDIVINLGMNPTGENTTFPHDIVMWLVRSVGGSAPRGGTTTELKATDQGGDGDEFIHLGVRGVADDDHMNTFRISYIDEPNTTSTTTYSIRGRNQNGSSNAQLRFNASYNLSEDWSDRGVSLFQLQEIDAAPQLSNVSTTGVQAGQALVYNSSNQWVPRGAVEIASAVPSAAAPEGTLKYYNGKLYLRAGSAWVAFTED